MRGLWESGGRRGNVPLRCRKDSTRKTSITSPFDYSAAKILTGVSRLEVDWTRVRTREKSWSRDYGATVKIKQRLEVNHCSGQWQRKNIQSTVSSIAGKLTVMVERATGTLQAYTYSILGKYWNIENRIEGEGKEKSSEKKENHASTGVATPKKQQFKHHQIFNVCNIVFNPTFHLIGTLLCWDVSSKAAALLTRS